MIACSLSSYLEGFERYTPESGGGGLDMDNAGYQDEDRRHTPSGGYIQATRESDDIEKLGFKIYAGSGSGHSQRPDLSRAMSVETDMFRGGESSTFRHS